MRDTVTIIIVFNIHRQTNFMLYQWRICLYPDPEFLFRTSALLSSLQLKWKIKTPNLWSYLKNNFADFLWRRWVFSFLLDIAEYSILKFYIYICYFKYVIFRIILIWGELDSFSDSFRWKSSDFSIKVYFNSEIISFIIRTRCRLKTPLAELYNAMIISCFDYQFLQNTALD